MCVLRVRATTSPLGATSTAVLKPSPSSEPSGAAARSKSEACTSTPDAAAASRAKVTVGPSSSDSAVASGRPVGQRVGGVARQRELGEEDDAGPGVGGRADAVEQGRAQPVGVLVPGVLDEADPDGRRGGLVDTGEGRGHPSGGDQAHGRPVCRWPRRSVRTAYDPGMRHSRFWALAEDEFGAAYAHSLAGSTHIAALGGRTAVEALDAGIPPRDVWFALCDVDGRARGAPARPRQAGASTVSLR